MGKKTEREFLSKWFRDNCKDVGHVNYGKIQQLIMDDLIIITENEMKEEIKDWHLMRWRDNPEAKEAVLDFVEYVKEWKKVCFPKVLTEREVDEEWVKERATENYNLSYYKTFNLKQVIDSIRSLVEEIPAKKATVDEEFVRVYVGMINEDPHQCLRENLIGMLREAGVEVII